MKNNIANAFLDYLKILNCSFDGGFLNFCSKIYAAESKKLLGGFSQNLQCRYIQASRFAVQIYIQIRR